MEHSQGKIDIEAINREIQRSLGPKATAFIMAHGYFAWKETGEEGEQTEEAEDPTVKRLRANLLCCLRVLFGSMMSDGVMKTIEGAKEVFFDENTEDEVMKILLDLEVLTEEDLEKCRKPKGGE